MESKAPFLQTGEVQLQRGFATKTPFSDASPPSPSRLAVPNAWAWAGERLVPARSARRGLAGHRLPDTSRLPARAGALFQLFPPGDPADLTQALACHFPAPGFCSEFLLSEVSSEGSGGERDAGGDAAARGGEERVRTARWGAHGSVRAVGHAPTMFNTSPGAALQHAGVARVSGSGGHPCTLPPSQMGKEVHGWMGTGYHPAPAPGAHGRGFVAEDPDAKGQRC